MHEAPAISSASSSSLTLPGRSHTSPEPERFKSSDDERRLWSLARQDEP